MLGIDFETLYILLDTVVNSEWKGYCGIVEAFKGSRRL